MVCLCAMSSNCVWLQIIFCSCVNETTIFFFHSCDRSYVKMADRFQSTSLLITGKKQTRGSNDKTRLSKNTVICQCLADQLFASAEIIDLLVSDKSRYFAQAPPIIVHCLSLGFCKGKPEEILFFRSDFLRVNLCVNISSKQSFSTPPLLVILL